MMFKGKTVAITGAAGGIGQSLCRHFGEEGAVVFALDKSAELNGLQAAGLEVTGVKDVTPQAHNGCRPRKRRRV